MDLSKLGSGTRILASQINLASNVVSMEAPVNPSNIPVIYVSVDFGASLVKAIYQVNGKLGAVAMEPQTLEIPIDSIRNRKSISGSLNAALPEDDAWLTYKKRADTGIVLGHLAKQFNIATELKQLKYEKGSPKLLAVIGSIIQKECLDTNEDIEIKISVLLPYGEFINRDRLQQQFESDARNYYFRNQRVNLSVEKFACIPEGGGLIAGLTRDKGEEWFANRTVVVLMCGHRNTSLLIFERGALSRESQTTDLGFMNLVDAVIERTALNNASSVAQRVYELGNNISPDNNSLRLLIRSQDSRNIEDEAQQLTEVIANARQEYWALIKQWLSSVMPKELDELIIAGGAAYYLKPELDRHLAWAEPSWGAWNGKEEDEIKRIFTNHPNLDNLAIRFKDVYVMHQAMYSPTKHHSNSLR